MPILLVIYVLWPGPVSACRMFFWFFPPKIAEKQNQLTLPRLLHHRVQRVQHLVPIFSARVLKNVPHGLMYDVQGLPHGVQRAHWQLRQAKFFKFFRNIYSQREKVSFVEKFAYVFCLFREPREVPRGDGVQVCLGQTFPLQEQTWRLGRGWVGIRHMYVDINKINK